MAGQPIHGGLDPGQLIGLAELPTTKFLDALVDILEHADARSAFVREGLGAPRAGDADVLAIERDLIELLGWVIRRMRASAQFAAGPSVAPRRTLALLPRNSVLAHVLRRAVPFAALGIPVVCSAPPAVRGDLDRIVELVARALGLGRALRSSPWDSPTSYARMPPGSLVAFTGRRNVLAQLVPRHGIEVVAATGRCSIVLGTEAADVMDLLGALCDVHRSASCTRPRVALLVNPALTAASHAALSEPRPIGEMLTGIHPSVLFVPASEATGAPDFLSGYRLFPCGPNGECDTSVGLARDPTFGWPGDYLI